ncbi:unnamed protein product [Linum tenue]|uniref:Uncharacterized protein n=1 Tax=Linum tenue TaxID=586396 RepID=A0AAV0KTD5_9ROSI|nr:unnamed protein product [Linum tenue]
MALCALHLQLRYREKSDGLTGQELDHGWMVYSSKKKDPNNPDSFQMCEALLTMLVELGKSKQQGKAVT